MSRRRVSVRRDGQRRWGQRRWGQRPRRPWAPPGEAMGAAPRP